MILFSNNPILQCDIESYKLRLKLSCRRNKQIKQSYGFTKDVSFLFSAVTTTDASSSPAALTPKKDYVYETKEEAKQAFKELLKEKVW
jgi:hypothetical protein